MKHYIMVAIMSCQGIRIQRKKNNLQKVETKFEKNWPNSVVNYTGPALSC